MTLVAFDFDGTLSDSEMTVLLGATRGVADEMASITEQSMNGEIDYAESLYKRIDLLEGLAHSEVDAALGTVKLRPGAGALITDLRNAGHDVAILTGGFERGVDVALERAEVEVDNVVANRLLVGNGSLTGEVEGPLIEGTKDDALVRIAQERGVDPAKAVAIGDGANDLPMLDVAGLGIGFRPKPAVESQADEVVDSMAALRDVLTEHELLS